MCARCRAGLKSACGSTQKERSLERKNRAKGAFSVGPVSYFSRSRFISFLHHSLPFTWFQIIGEITIALLLSVDKRVKSGWVWLEYPTLPEISQTPNLILKWLMCVPIPVHTHMHNLVPPEYFLSLYELTSYIQIPNSGLGHHPDSFISAPSLYFYQYCLQVLLGSASYITWVYYFLCSPLLLPSAGHQSRYSSFTTGASTIRFPVSHLLFTFLKPQLTKTNLSTASSQPEQRLACSHLA